MHICIASMALVEAGVIVQAYEILIYVGVLVCFVCCTLCCTSLSPLRLGGGGGLAIADSHRNLGTLLGSSRGYILPAGVG